MENIFYDVNILPRQIRPELLRRLKQYPAVALVAPRQCGKTTLGHRGEAHTGTVAIRHGSVDTNR